MVKDSSAIKRAREARSEEVSGLQKVNERLREEYAAYGMPLIQYLAKIHGISIVEFARIIGISKNHAEAVMKHRVFPTLEVAVKIARYFEMNVDLLFSWRIDDTGERRPLIVEIPGKGWTRLRVQDDVAALRLAKQIGGKGCSSSESTQESVEP